MSNNIAHLDTSALDTAAKFFRTMQKAGADFTGPMQDTKQRRNLVTYLQMGCPKVNDNGEMMMPELPRGEGLCRDILGDYFLSTKEMSVAFGFEYSGRCLDFFEKLPA